MTNKAMALAKLARLTRDYVTENPFSMHPLTSHEWERTLEQAVDDAYGAGAEQDEIEAVRDVFA